MWQDYLLTATAFGFSLALLPSVFSKNKPKKVSCLLTALLLVGNLVALYTLGLPFAFISTLLNTIVWLILFIQKR